jgi:hypothetical protein
MRSILVIPATALLFAVLTTASAFAGTLPGDAVSEPTDTVVIGRPIEPYDGDATTKVTAARAGVPMVETLSPVGPSIVPLAEAPTSATPVRIM